MATGLPILFLSFGGPEGPEEIMPFLESVTRGRGIPRERLLGVAEHYRQMGGKSPINEITRQQARLLSEELARRGDPRAVVVGQRHAAPFTIDAMREIDKLGAREAIALCTAPYRSEASVARYSAAVEEARALMGGGAPRVRFVGSWFDHPRFISALASRARQAQAPRDAALLFTAHSIPCALAKRSVYVEELRETCALVARELGRERWTLAYTSRSGDPRDAWLEPDAKSVLAELAAAGARDALVVPVGFVADHVEVLYDLDVDARAAAQAAGLRLHRAATVGDHPDFIGMLADVVQAGPRGGDAWAVASDRCATRAGRTLCAVGAGGACLCFPGREDAPCRSAAVAQRGGRDAKKA